MATYYIQCKVLPGLFEQEVYVIVDTSSAYVSRADVKVGDLVSGQEVDGLVKAFVLQERAGEALIELPGEPVVGGLRTWVPTARLAASA
jgi:hypothetical protein